MLASAAEIIHCCVESFMQLRYYFVMSSCLIYEKLILTVCKYYVICIMVEHLRAKYLFDTNVDKSVHISASKNAANICQCLF